MPDQISRKHTTLRRAHELRESATDAERKLWASLRGSALEGLKFRRQQPFGPYILDFYCHELRLVIELDGGQHYEPKQLAHDAHRTAFLQDRGLRVIRFTNLDVLQNLEAVIEKLLEVVDRGPSPQPSPAGRGSITSIASTWMSEGD